MQWFPNGGTPSCWDLLPSVGPDFDLTIGVWGGWAAVFESSVVGDLFVEVYPIAWGPGWVRWRMVFEVFGGQSGDRVLEEAAGFYPTFTFLPGELTDCPESWATLILAGP